jgi:malate dehydrogenase (oxaloacetate-decarboxylating)
VDTKDVDEFVETVVRISPGFGIASLMVEAGARRVFASDPNPLSHERAEVKGIEVADMETVMREADVVVATTGVPGLIKPKMIKQGQVILALTNPYPEIDPEVAVKAGAAFAADGKSVNNVLGYPGIFRGALLSGAREINVEMKLAAARVIADLTEASTGLVPDVLDPNVHERVAEAMCDAAIESRVAWLERVPAEGLARGSVDEAAAGRTF